MVFLTHSRRDKRVYIIPKGISPKVNEIARLRFELAYFEAAVQLFSYYITETHTYTYMGSPQGMIYIYIYIYICVCGGGCWDTNL